MTFLRLLPLLLIASSCGSTKTVPSSSVDQKNIHESYTASYDKTSGRLNYISQFRRGSMWGDSLILESGSNVKVQNQEMRSSKLSSGEKLAGALLPIPFGFITSLTGGNWYVWQEERADVKGHETVGFDYTRNDGVTTTQNLVFPVAVTVKSAGNVSKTKNYAVELSRAAASKDEKVQCSLRSKGSSLGDKDPNQTVTYALAYGEDGICIFSAEKLQKFVKGPAEILVSVRNSKISDDDKIYTNAEIISTGTPVTVED